MQYLTTTALSGQWKMTNRNWSLIADYYQLVSVVAPIAQAVPDVATATESITQTDDRWYVVLDITNTFCAILLIFEDQGQFIFR